MNTKMLNYTKDVLIKVSFDINLFRKELAKSYKYLMEKEREDLKKWVLQNFGPQYYLQPC